MSNKQGRTEMSPDLRAFLTEIGEVVKDYLETKHEEHREISELTKDGEEDESRRVFPSH